MSMILFGNYPLIAKEYKNEVQPVLLKGSAKSCSFNSPRRVHSLAMKGYLSIIF